MQLSHEFTVPAGLDETWAAFDDIAGVGACFPGAQVTGVDGDTFTGTVKVKLGPIALVYGGTGTFVEKDESARTMRIEAKGKDKRGNGTAGADVVATMTDVGGSTRVQVVTDLAITGKPAQFGRGVIQDVSDKLLGKFTECLATKLGSPAEADTEADAGSSAVEAPVPAKGPAVASDGPVADPNAPSAAKASGPRPVTSSPSPSSGSDEALDLGATVLPVLAKAYWKQAAGALLVLLVVVRVLRRG